MPTPASPKFLCAAIALGVLTALSAPATLAGNSALLELIDIMERKGTLTREEADLLRRAARDEEKRAVAAVEESREEAKAEAKKEVATAIGDQPKIDLKEGFKLTSADGNFEWKIGGRLQTDLALYDEDSSTPDLNDETEIRRARLEMEARLWKVWGFKFQYDFTGSGEAGIRDAYIDYSGLGNTTIQVGNFKEPFSLEELTSSKYTTFMERSLPVALAPGRRIGLGLSTHFHDTFTVAGGVFGESVEEVDAAGVDSGLGVTGRVTFSPLHRAGRVLHLGGAVSWRDTNDRETVRLRERFETHLTDTRIVDTGTIQGVDGTVRYGLEAAGVFGRFSVQGEYIRTEVDLRPGFGRDPDFDGWYAYASVFLTPDSRPYKFAEGTFDKVSPSGVVGQGGIGAWEIGVRLSNLDLTEGTVAGGDIDTLTAALNWYATRNLRFMVNYVKVLDSDANVFGGGAFGGAEPAVFQTRAQVFW